ncbi:DUF423 domain-containing protein [Flavobacteriaceae bacterium F89]|uniref:DUF423 domain-containing protein n=1 Tax=Cerina litoralis TaxID=2874477 RepID=A0AAE3EVW1_9FLAO|nr:DUF423 domain-containing protein [Cerina litoralis]MCG2460612.1 DUF423 domain-containing protein [Cerina litoralis]
MNRTIFITAIVFGALAIALGAFGAHALKEALSAAEIQVFETGVRYQMYHALLLLFMANTLHVPEQKKKLVFYLIAIGVVLFSFSIYLLATNNLTGFDFKTIGFVTPIGGILLLSGWVILGYRFIRHKSNQI